MAVPRPSAQAHVECGAVAPPFCARGLPCSRRSGKPERETAAASRRTPQTSPFAIQYEAASSPVFGVGGLHRSPDTGPERSRARTFAAVCAAPSGNLWFSTSATKQTLTTTDVTILLFHRELKHFFRASGEQIEYSLYIATSLSLQQLTLIVLCDGRDLAQERLTLPCQRE